MCEVLPMLFEVEVCPGLVSSLLGTQETSTHTVYVKSPSLLAILAELLEASMFGCLLFNSLVLWVQTDLTVPAEPTCIWRLVNYCIQPVVWYKHKMNLKEISHKATKKMDVDCANI